MNTEPKLNETHWWPRMSLHYLGLDFRLWHLWQIRRPEIEVTRRRGFLAPTNLNLNQPQPTVLTNPNHHKPTTNLNPRHNQPQHHRDPSSNPATHCRQTYRDPLRPPRPIKQTSTCSWTHHHWTLDR